MHGNTPRSILMAYYLCTSSPEDIADGFCPQWIEVTGVTTTGDPIFASAFVVLPAEVKLYAFALGALPLFSVFFLIVTVRMIMRLAFDASGPS